MPAGLHEYRVPHRCTPRSWCWSKSGTPSSMLCGAVPLPQHCAEQSQQADCRIVCPTPACKGTHLQCQPCSRLDQQDEQPLCPSGC